MLNIVAMSKTINDCTSCNFVPVEFRILKNMYVAGFIFILVCLSMVW